jgi:hypothetical protein
LSKEGATQAGGGGQLVAPWSEELKAACERAGSGLDGRELVQISGFWADHVTKFAQSFGAIGLKIERPEEISSTLKTALAMQGPVIVGVPVDYCDNHRLIENVHLDTLNWNSTAGVRKRLLERLFKRGRSLTRPVSVLKWKHFVGWRFESVCRSGLSLIRKCD